MVVSRAETSTHCSGTRELSSAPCNGGYRFSIHFQASSRFATSTGVYRVRQRSDVDIKEKTVCTESEQPHLCHESEGRACECGKGRVHPVSKRNVRYGHDAQISSNRCPGRCGRRRSNEVASEFSRKIFTCTFVLVACVPSISSPTRDPHRAVPDEVQGTADLRRD